MLQCSVSQSLFFNYNKMCMLNLKMNLYASATRIVDKRALFCSDSGLTLWGSEREPRFGKA